LPGSIMFKHSIKDNEQFTHTSSKGDLLGFTCCQQPLIEGANDRVMAGGYQYSHIEGGTDTGAATPNCTFPAQGTTIPVQRSYSSQCSYTLSIQGSQFRQVGQEGDCQLRPYTRHRSQQVFLFTPYRAVMQHLLQASIYLIQFLLEPGDMSLDSLVYWWSGRIQPVFLSNQHAHHLIPASYQSGKSLSLRVRKGTWSGTNRFSKISQDLGIQSIGLGQLSGGFGKIPYLSGVDNYDRQTGGSQSSDHRKFQPARCFKEHQSRVKVSKLVDQALNTLLGVSNLPLLAGGADSDIQPCLGDVDSDESGFLIHYNLLEYFIALPMHDTGLVSPGNCSGFLPEGCGDPRFLTVSSDPEGIGLPRPFTYG